MKPLKNFVLVLLALLAVGLMTNSVSAQEGQETQAPATEVQVEVPDVQVAPEVQVPEVNVEAPQVEIPDVNVQAPSVDLPDVNVQAPAAVPDTQVTIQEQGPEESEGAGFLFWSVGIVALVLFALAIGMMFSGRDRTYVHHHESL